MKRTKNLRSWFIGGAAVVLMFLVWGCAGTAGKHEMKGSGDTGSSEKVMVVCPVSGNRFGPPNEAMSSTYKGKKYYFCCPGCKEQFDENPEKYTGEKKGGS